MNDYREPTKTFVQSLAEYTIMLLAGIGFGTLMGLGLLGMI